MTSFRHVFHSAGTVREFDTRVKVKKEETIQSVSSSSCQWTDIRLHHQKSSQVQVHGCSRSVCVQAERVCGHPGVEEGEQEVVVEGGWIRGYIAFDLC